MYRAEIYRLFMAALIVGMGVVSLSVALAPVEAGVLETPTGGIGQGIHAPAPTGDRFQIDGASGREN